jgi:hypothetical protein
MIVGAALLTMLVASIAACAAMAVTLPVDLILSG